MDDGGQSFCYLYAQRCEAEAADHEAEASHNAYFPFCLSTVDDRVGRVGITSMTNI